jgi:hypothetical protein
MTVPRRIGHESMHVVRMRARFPASLFSMTGFSEGRGAEAAHHSEGRVVGTYCAGDGVSEVTTAYSFSSQRDLR